MTLDIFSSRFSFHVLLYWGLCNERKKQIGERQKDRKIYKREKVSRKDLHDERERRIMPKTLLMIMRTKARDRLLEEARARDCDTQGPKIFADSIRDNCDARDGWRGGRT